MTGELSLGIDIGTSATKFVLLDPEVGVIAEESEPSGYTAPRPGFAEADPDGWWANIAAGTSRLLRKAQRTGGDVGAVGVSGMVPTIVLLDAEGRVLRPSIQQNDARAVSEIVWIRDRTEAADILRRTGSAVTQQSLAPKLRWLRDHEPDVMSAARHLCGSYDFAVHRLTGEWSAERNWALESGLYDLTTGTWDESLLALAEIPKSWVAPVHRPADIVGVVSRAAAAVTGLADGTPVVAGSADHVASALAAGVARPGDLLVKLGSAGDVLFCSDEARVDRRLFLDYHLMDDRFLPNGCMASSGSLLQWFQRELGAGMPLRALDDEASGVRPGAEGLIVLPYFLGEKTPLFDPLARGTVVGLTLSHSRAHLFRAFLEGISFGFRHHIEVLAELGWLPTRVRCTNGGADSKLWKQVAADVLGLPLEQVAGNAGSPLGAAFAAGMGAGIFSDWEQVHRFVRIASIVEPDQVAHGRYEALYPIFRDTYDRLKDVYPRLVARGGEDLV
ncbi:MAG: FGGY-family carbohydrate kinase [Candidatus Dormiibacterota bacterium]